MKRVMDVLTAVLALMVLSPLLFGIAVVVRVRLGAPVLFRQQRPGLNGDSFTLYKFRTMRHAMGSDGELLPDEERMTRFGSFLRSTSLDELPELWNVLKGDMSLVGPRPLLMEYLSLFSPKQARRHEMRPGITGWAQVNGRNELDWEERLSMDVWYVDNRTLALDLRIILLTIWKVLRQEGISQEGEATMERFRGSSGHE